ncbi:hypothetical protein LF1_47530 [Rubripirellula obstinata]|uniref:Type 4 fimbrial biogenesis protein PilX N-terminal domain-containing protein n=1 Tax=Rubripirellula obstinata TaxID=406547 RepID=A0A5B1CPK7_9BACT|nr:hypothetical protein [Rubripirellula obstinata]KAA1262191.1 hypothetical protein LF1_47530 [Rubripirellula obstinata]
MFNKRRNRGGYAMLIVLAIVLSSTALATIQMRHLDSALRIERARIEAEEYSAGSLSVLALAIDRLQTGDPPTPFNYGHLHTTAGASTWYRISYAKVIDQWTVTATPDVDASALLLLPASF